MAIKSNKPTQSYDTHFRNSQRAWLRTGDTEFGTTKPKHRRSETQSFGNLDRKRGGIQSGHLVVFAHGTQAFCFRYGDTLSKDELPPDMLEQGILVISKACQWATAVRGRVEGESLWIITGPGLPKPYGRRIEVTILSIF